VTPAPSLDRRAVPQLYIRWVDPETGKIAGWERVPDGMTPEAAHRTIRAAVQTYLIGVGETR